MSTFTASRVVDIDGVELTVRELSVADVRKLMQEVSDQDLVNMSSSKISGYPICA